MSDLDALFVALVGDNEWLRHQALERLRSEGAPADRIREFVRFLGGDDPGRRAGARMALAALAAPGSPAFGAARDALLGALQSDDVDLRILAASALGESGNTELAAALIDVLDDPDANVVAAATDALGELRDPSSLHPLSRLGTRSEFWVRAAAVVALGRLRDPRGIAALEVAARTPGLAGAVAEALRRIDDPAALGLLEGIHADAPAEALVAAGSILSSHPDVADPPWVVKGARALEDALVDRLVEEDEPAVARLLGIAGSAAGIDALLTLAGPPRRSEAALNGLLAAPAHLRVDPILRRLDDAEPDDQVALLSLLPPLDRSDRIDRVVPLLTHDHERVRAAAAESLARSPADHALPALAEALAGDTVHPEVVRATGGLGSAACMALTPLLRDPAAAVRAAAADALARCADPGLAEQIEAAIATETDPAARRALLRALAATAGERAVATLRAALDDADPDTVAAVIDALGATGSVNAVEPLVALLDSQGYQRLMVIRALGDLAIPAVATHLESSLQDPDLDVRRAAARAALPVARELPVSAIETLARDEDARIRAWAVRMFAARGPDARDALTALAEHDSDPTVRAEALHVLHEGG